MLTQNIKNFVRENFKLLRIVHKSDSSLDTALFKDSSLEPIFNHFVTRAETKEALPTILTEILHSEVVWL